MSRTPARVACCWLAATATAHASPASPSPGAGDGSAPVVGGSEAPPGKWPDAVAVLGRGSCTGTLIAPDVVLTAGHCAGIDPTQVVADTTNYNVPGGATAAVERVVAYPSWDASYDVSVIVLATPIEGVAPRKLGTACTFDRFERDTMVHLVGFGLTETTGIGDNTQLHEALAPVIDPDCSGPGGCVPSIRPGGEFIAGGDGTDSCYGDSGGPVYLDTPRGPVAVGAVSRGLAGAATPCGDGGIYVRTDKLVTWIEEAAGRPVAKDLCGAEGEDEVTPAEVTGGCAAAGGGDRGALLGIALVALTAGRRRRGRRGGVRFCPDLGRRPPDRTDDAA